MLCIIRTVRASSTNLVINRSHTYICQALNQAVTCRTLGAKASSITPGTRWYCSDDRNAAGRHETSWYDRPHERGGRHDQSRYDSREMRDQSHDHGGNRYENQRNSRFKTKRKLHNRQFPAAEESAQSLDDSETQSASDLFGTEHHHHIKRKEPSKAESYMNQLLHSGSSTQSEHHRETEEDALKTPSASDGSGTTTDEPGSAAVRQIAELQGLKQDEEWTESFGNMSDDVQEYKDTKLDEQR